MEEVQEVSILDIITNKDSGPGKVLFCVTVGISIIYGIVSTIVDEYNKESTKNRESSILKILSDPWILISMSFECWWQGIIVNLGYSYLHSAVIPMIPVIYLIQIFKWVFEFKKIK